jgi:hypothetical protein
MSTVNFLTLLLVNKKIFKDLIVFKYRCSKNSARTVHYGVVEITVNVRKMSRK